MSKELKKIPCKTSIADAAQKMRDEQVGALFIEKNGELVGSVSDRELVRGIGILKGLFVWTGKYQRTR